MVEAAKKVQGKLKRCFFFSVFVGLCQCVLLEFSQGKRLALYMKKLLGFELVLYLCEGERENEN